VNRRRLALAARTALVLGMLAAGSGCVSARAYFHDRWRDAKDVFTVTAGTGGGAKVRVGPVQVGVFLNSDYTGLRGGAGFYLKDKVAKRLDEQRIADFVSPIPIPGPCVVLASDEVFDPGWISGDGENCDPIAEQRGKYFRARSSIPFVSGADRPEYFTQIEVAAGIGCTLRLGFNVGELLDFLLGWTTLDIYGDDLEARKERR
jgi:hypothetical protein